MRSLTTSCRSPISPNDDGLTLAEGRELLGPLLGRSANSDH